MFVDGPRIGGEMESVVTYLLDTCKGNVLAVCYDCIVAGYDGSYSSDVKNYFS